MSVRRGTPLSFMTPMDSPWIWTQEILGEKGYEIDADGFKACMKRTAGERARKARRPPITWVLTHGV